MNLSCTDTEIRGFKNFGVTSLTFWGHVTSSVTWPLDSAYVVFYWRSIETMHRYRLAPLWRYMAPNILGSRPWPFRVTWGHRSRDHWTRYMWFPIGGPLEPSVYLAPLRRYWAPKIMGSRVRLFGVTWRHRSRNHWTRYMWFPIGGPLEPSVYLAPLRRYKPQSLKFSTLGGFFVG